MLNLYRHGVRLDAADKQWHLTSPAPYDPPLTYGGWRQSHSLGARIAHILHNREVQAEHPPTNGVHKHSSLRSSTVNGHIDDGTTSRSNRPKKHRVILHTSPFLRCIQTSIAISAGLAEAQASLEPPDAASTRAPLPHSSHTMHSGSPHIRAMNHWDSPQLSAISEPEEFNEDQAHTSQPSLGAAPKPLLRIDAFLGEWFSPGYYEDITHPPDSVMMVAGAKAGLLRENHNTSQTQGTGQVTPALGNFPGGWGGAAPEPIQSSNDGDNGPLSRVSDLNRTLPRLNRSTSHSSAGSLAHRSIHQVSKEIPDGKSPDVDSYVSPIPSYAISPLAPIPPGYVAHASAACINVDFQWDSMRPPHEWGDGGQYGEEWSSMHKRFRRGLQQMFLWYGQLDPKVSSTTSEDAAEWSKLDDEDEQDIDTVLVLVTHSAGCNALIGALTNQPVLLDAGMASLTMAVRRPESNEVHGHSSEPLSPGSSRRRSSVDFGISEHYEVRITASTDHLRTGSATTSRRSTNVSTSQNPSRHRSSSSTSSSSSISTADGPYPTKFEDAKVAAEGLYRSASAAAPRSTGLWAKPVNNTSIGLWSSPTSEKPKVSFDQRLPLNDSVSHETTAEAKAEPEQNGANGLKPLPLEGNGHPVDGLWATPLNSSPSDRDKGSKRRWTHSDHR